MEKLLSFLDRLERAGIYYRLNKVRDAIMVEAAVPGERWEIEFFGDGGVAAERFVSSGDILDESGIEGLFEHFSD